MRTQRAALVASRYVVILALLLGGGCDLLGLTNDADPLEDRWMGTDERGTLRLDLTHEGSRLAGSFSGHVQMTRSLGLNVHGTVEGRVTENQIDLDLIREDADDGSFTGVFRRGDEKQIIGTWTGQYGQFYFTLEPYEIKTLSDT